MEAIKELVTARFPGAIIESCEPLGDDERAGDATVKGSGYGVPIRVRFRDGGRDRSAATRRFIRRGVAGQVVGRRRNCDRHKGPSVVSQRFVS